MKSVIAPIWSGFHRVPGVAGLVRSWAAAKPRGMVEGSMGWTKRVALLEADEEEWRMKAAVVAEDDERAAAVTAARRPYSWLGYTV